MCVCLCRCSSLHALSGMTLLVDCPRLRYMQGVVLLEPGQSVSNAEISDVMVVVADFTLKDVLSQSD